ncbi:Oidioi.mRNA.OKI2018_I69.YSR.g17174.t1.cds [Oikopleura dioica]|uniref:Oidioi.mRNA.OKI2018_I69.YSR.g17174.t1.cds n=1 Tax=Oikopleura dioica TaxID=34765 RepID=A0ABN7SSP9_OIKDI|nr:Oidioi.mRNA.OKI2018_I69.YSR.g17174.t1.cds [Oikopleura dioica]
MGVTDMDGNTSIDMVNRRIIFEKFKVAPSYDHQNVLKISTKHELSDENFEPDARKTYKEKLEKMRKEARESSTVDDIVLGEVVKENPKLEVRLMTKIRDKKYKKVFSKVTGCLPKEFQISAPMMRVELSNQVTRQKNEQMSDEKKEIVAKHLYELARDYIVVFPQDHGISVKNIIPIMVVEKRDDQGEAIPLAQSARIVAQAHRSVNLWTKAPPRVTDELKDVLAKAAKASKNKFIFRTVVKDLQDKSSQGIDHHETLGAPKASDSSRSPVGRPKNAHSNHRRAEDSKHPHSNRHPAKWADRADNLER